MRLTHCSLLLFLLAAWSVPATAEDVLGPDTHFIPGAIPTSELRYRSVGATNVAVSGSWDRWTVKSPMKRGTGGVWSLDVSTLGMRFGRHEYKFVVNGKWEKGDNRILYANEQSLLEQPSDVILSASIDGIDRIKVHFSRPIDNPETVTARIEPHVPLRGAKFLTANRVGHPEGFVLTGDLLKFVFDPASYDHPVSSGDMIVVAGNFNAWSGSDSRWQLHDPDGDGVWELSAQLSSLRAPPEEAELLFKYVVNGSAWLPPPADALNAAPDGKGHVNLRLVPGGGSGTVLDLRTREPLDLSRSYVVAVDGASDQTVRRMATPGSVFDDIYSEKELGPLLNREQEATTYRVFAPRARTVHLCIFDTPYQSVQKPKFRWLDPVERFPMWEDEGDGVWELSLRGLDIGKYYAFQVSGPEGDGESFNPEAAIGDPYAKAAPHGENNPLVVDMDATNEWFGGWTDEEWKIPAMEDAVIYEAHLRDLTMHPSSGVPESLRGGYQGLLASEGTGTGLDHLKDLGVNMIELLPICEFNNGATNHNWGYTTVYFFAPEASYAQEPIKGSQFYEFKHLVNELHRQGFGVIMDVVYNHVGSPNVFSMLDKKYYFRLKPDYTYSNFSGVGNDVRSESPMMRRLIVDNILYWMKEFHVDGFRFDLAELIDMETLMAIRDAARELNPDVMLISEPWSFRGEHKSQLRGTGWSAWNNDFRYAIKEFAMGGSNREWLAKSVAGSIETWAATPLQPVNYAESHDDMSLADELHPDHNGMVLTEDAGRRHRLVATVLFTSLGVPMIAEGQEYIRSKRGISNSYNKGDEINALNWTERDRPIARTTQNYYKSLIHLRGSKAGASFRLSEAPPEDYYQWILPENEQAFGYIVNAPQAHNGAGFIVLLNAGDEPVDFSVPVPEGTWRMVSDGTRVTRDGLPDTPVIVGPRTLRIRVPAVRSAILMNGF